MWVLSSLNIKGQRREGCWSKMNANIVTRVLGRARDSCSWNRRCVYFPSELERCCSAVVGFMRVVYGVGVGVCVCRKDLGTSSNLTLMFYLMKLKPRQGDWDTPGYTGNQCQSTDLNHVPWTSLCGHVINLFSDFLGPPESAWLFTLLKSH